jgi:hypothetical protein
LSLLTVGLELGASVIGGIVVAEERTVQGVEVVRKSEV